jgi:hypothetical protein
MRLTFARFEGFQDPGGIDLRRDTGAPRSLANWRTQPLRRQFCLLPLLSPFRVMLWLWRWGALDFYGCQHDFTVFFCAPVVFTPLSYFVDHL